MQTITIVAEAGINHNGDVDRAIQLVLAAKRCGADAIKFQLFTEQARPRGRKYILTREQWGRVASAARACWENQIEIFWSVFDFESVALAKSLGAKWVKLSFVERRNLQLIQRCEKAGFKRLIVSVDLQGQYPRRDGWEYLYCPNNGWSGYYPTNLEHIEWMEYAEAVRQTGIGYSCHAVDFYPCVVAAGLGAGIIEKHFKLDETGPDAEVSLNPTDFATMVKLIRGWR